MHAFLEPGREWGTDQRQRILRRFRHLLATDPDGAWMIDGDGRADGMAVGFRRGGIWVLAFLAVHADAHGSGLGRALLRRSLEYAQGTRAQMLCASTHTAALHVYSTHGFSLLPSMELRGAVDRARIPASPGVRPGGEDDLELCAAVDEAVRGAARSEDIAMLLDVGTRLFVSERPRGYALVLQGRCNGIAAEDEATARSLMWAMLAETGTDEEASVSWITAPQQWAIQVGLGAGLRLYTDGPVCVRGETGPLYPWLPNGALL